MKDGVSESRAKAQAIFEKVFITNPDSDSDRKINQTLSSVYRFAVRRGDLYGDTDKLYKKDFEYVLKKAGL